MRYFGKQSRQGYIKETITLIFKKELEVRSSKLKASCIRSVCDQRKQSWAHLSEMHLLLPSDTHRKLRHILQPETWTVAGSLESSVLAVALVIVALEATGNAEDTAFCQLDTMTACECVTII